MDVLLLDLECVAISLAYYEQLALFGVDGCVFMTKEHAELPVG
jgi:hypothetical protein